MTGNIKETDTGHVALLESRHAHVKGMDDRLENIIIIWERDIEYMCCKSLTVEGLSVRLNTTCGISRLSSLSYHQLFREIRALWKASISLPMGARLDGVHCCLYYIKTVIDIGDIVAGVELIFQSWKQRVIYVLSIFQGFFLYWLVKCWHCLISCSILR
jgi:hypothetical protein